MILSSRQVRKEKGMALLLVLISVMALTMIVAGLWQASQPSWEESTLERAQFQAGLLAESGLAIATHPDVEPGDVALVQGQGTGREFTVKITREGGRIPVNEMSDETLRDAVVGLFVTWGVDAASATRAAESLADWIDEDSETLPNGAENTFYSGLNFSEFPNNEPFTSLEQMLFVSGMDVVAKYQPMWRDYFTLYSDGQIDLNSAPWEVVVAIAGATQDAALSFVATRNGDDGIESTIDDYQFEDTGEVQALLGLSDSEWNEIAYLLTLSGGVLRIESEGKVGDFTETRVLLVRESESNGQRTYTPVARMRL